MVTVSNYFVLGLVKDNLFFFKKHGFAQRPNPSLVRSFGSLAIMAVFGSFRSVTLRPQLSLGLPFSKFLYLLYDKKVLNTILYTVLS